MDKSTSDHAKSVISQIGRAETETTVADASDKSSTSTSADKGGKPKSSDATRDKSSKKSQPKKKSHSRNKSKSKSNTRRKKQSASKDRDKSQSKSKKKQKRGSAKSEGKSKGSKKTAKTDHSIRETSSEDGYKLKDKPKSKPKEKRDAPEENPTSTVSDVAKSTASASDTMTTKKKKLIGTKVLKVEAMKGAIALANEKAVTNAGYLVQKPVLFSGEYSTVLHAKRTGTKCGLDRLVVKVVNLAECSPRCRVNLLQNSVRIMRFISGTAKGSEPLASVFVAVHDIFLVGGVRLFIFMAKCDSNRSLYDIVRSKQNPLASEIRSWCQSLVEGVHQLQRIGVAHRAIKLQHVLFDAVGNAKLVGWGKSVFFYDPRKKRILLQRKERRVRRNYHLPPEAFTGSYDPSHADIWSIGVVLVAICTKRYPFNVRDKANKFSSQWRNFIKKHQLNTHVRNFCNRTFVINPKRRISSDDLLKSKYFSAAADRLKAVNCKADPNEVLEDLQVGGVSALNMSSSTGQVSNDQPKEEASKSSAEPKAKEEAEEEEDEAADSTGAEEEATDPEGGGAVGEEENLSATEQEVESKVAEINAPEEAETEAQPEDGESAEAENEDEDSEEA